jgi:predicted dehydrogenase
VVEKSFTVTVKEGKELIELAGKKNKVLSVFQNRRWDGDFMTVRKIIENKLLGRLVEYESHYDRYRNFIKEGTWKEDPDSMTSILDDLGSHMIDQVLVLFGMPGSVYADIRKIRTGTKVNDYFHLELSYSDIKVTIKGSYLVREAGPRYTLHGTEGSFLKWGVDPQEEALLQGIYPNESGWGKEPDSQWGTLNTNIDNLHFQGKLETIPGAYINYFTNIYNAIAKGEELAVIPSEALNIIRVIEAARESDRLKKVIDI